MFRREKDISVSINAAVHCETMLNKKGWWKQDTTLWGFPSNDIQFYLAETRSLQKSADLFSSMSKCELDPDRIHQYICDMCVVKKTGNKFVSDILID